MEGIICDIDMYICHAMSIIHMKKLQRCSYEFLDLMLCMYICTYICYYLKATDKFT